MEPVPPPFSPRLRTWSILTALAGLVLVIWFQFFRDEPVRIPPGFSLPEPLPAVPDAENGLVYLQEAVNNQTWPKLEKEHREMIRWREPWDGTLMEPVVAAAPAMREILLRSLSYPGWRAESGPGSRFLYQPATRANDLLTAKIRELSEADQLDQAMDWVEALIRLCRRMEQTHDSLPSVMVGMGLSRTVHSTLMRVVAQPGADDAILARGFALLEVPMAGREAMLTGIMLDYRRDAASNFDPTKNSEINLGVLFSLVSDQDVPEWLIKSRFKPQAHHNLAMRHLALLEQLTKNADRYDWRGLREARGEFELESKLSLWSFDPNRAGRILAANYASFFKVAETCLPADAHRRCCRAAIAAKRWSLAHGGRRVQGLSELVPVYLPAVPVDPFDGLPLKWDEVTATVYVLGPDGVDNLPDFPPGEVSGFGEKGTGVRLP